MNKIEHLTFPTNSVTSSVTVMTLLTLLILTSIGWSSLALAQEAPQLIKLDTNLVTVNISVTDSKDRPIRGLDLGVEDFVITEDGKPVKLEFFDKRGPASIVFVIDISSSMEGKAQELRSAFKRFLRTGHEDNDYTLITFNASPRLIVRSVNADELWQAVCTLDPFGFTALYDAVLLGLQTLDQTPKQHRAMVIISDGDDNRSRASLADVERAVSTRHATVYTIGILSKPDGQLEFDLHCRSLLTRLAEATGGIVRFSTPANTSNILLEISIDVINQFCLGYYAPDDGPGWRSLKVSLASSDRRYTLRHQQRYLIR